MRVITGCARGKHLETLEGEDVRPTTDRVKEAIFSIIQFQIEGRRFLDLFAGSGQMGIEALSRGAEEVVFVDNRRESTEVIKNNLQSTGLVQKSKVLQTDSIDYLRGKNEKFDLAFLDPPYNSEILEEILPLVVNIMQDSGIIICESPQNKEISSKVGDFVLDRSYHYGKIKISTYAHKDVVNN